MGRRHHIEQTFLHNLALCQKHLSQFELVLVNYHSQDGLDTWVKENLGNALSNGQVQYYHTTHPTYFHVAHAKNLAHKLARYPLVVNLDADNYLSIFYLYALQRLQPKEILCVPFDQHFIPGSYGRIALYKEDFISLGGYDEHLNLGWGVEDRDFIDRAHASGLKKRFIPSPLTGSVIQHSNTERLQNRQDQSPTARDTALKRSRSNLAAGRLVANPSQPWGKDD